MTFTVQKIVQFEVKNTVARYKKKSQQNTKNAVIQGDPSFIWVNPPPGPEDEVLLGVQNGMGNTKVEIIGGSSADNDVTGKYRRFSLLYFWINRIMNGVKVFLSK